MWGVLSTMDLFNQLEVVPQLKFALHIGTRKESGFDVKPPIKSSNESMIVLVPYSSECAALLAGRYCGKTQTGNDPTAEC
jgi:hypothetical protein